MSLADLLVHTPALVVIALVLDLMFGDPVYPLHPIRLIGRLLTLLETALRKLGLNGYGGGVLLFLLLAFIVLGIIEGIYLALLQLGAPLAFAWHAYIAWSMIALRDLAKHGERVARSAQLGHLDLARERIACLVGRDTDKMDLGNCCRAAIESISENLTDGVIAPLFWFVIFGVPGLVVFKIASTMDSMVGYKNERYLQFGWCGARLDDLLNYLPARLTWLLMSVLSFLLPGFSGRECLRIGWQQHGIILGPNAGWSEAGAAGALKVRLVGPIWSHGKLVNDLWVGDPQAPPAESPHQVHQMIRLAYAVAIVFVVLALGIQVVFV